MRRSWLAPVVAFACGCGGKSDAPDVTLEVIDAGGQPAVRTHDGRFQVAFPGKPTLDPHPDMQTAVHEAADFSFKLLAVPIDYDASSDVPALYDEVRKRSWLAAGVSSKVTKDDVILIADQVARRLQIEIPTGKDGAKLVDEWLVYVPWERAAFALVATHADDGGKATARAEQLIATIAITRPNRAAH